MPLSEMAARYPCSCLPSPALRRYAQGIFHDLCITCLRMFHIYANPSYTSSRKSAHEFYRKQLILHKGFSALQLILLYLHFVKLNLKQVSQVCNSKETDTQRQVSLRGKHLVLGPCHTYCSPQTKYDRLAVVSNAQFECKKKKIYICGIFQSVLSQSLKGLYSYTNGYPKIRFVLKSKSHYLAFFLQIFAQQCLKNCLKNWSVRLFYCSQIKLKT